MTDWDWWFSKTASERLELIRAMRSSSDELSAARDEISKCDDIKLDQPSARCIFDLQNARAMAESKASNAKSFWVIERFENGKSDGYWTGESSRDFTMEIEKAIQFHRRDDAVCIKRGWHWDDVQVTEHVTMDAH